MILVPIQPTLYFGCSTFLGSLSPKHSPHSSNTPCYNQQKVGHFQTTHIPGNSSQYSKLHRKKKFTVLVPTQEHTSINFVAWQFALDASSDMQGIWVTCKDAWPQLTDYMPHLLEFN